jgi:SdrD B-like domain
MKAVITFAVALTLIVIASPARAQLCVEEGVDLCGFVWNDTNGDGIQNDDTDMDGLNGDQSGLTDVKVSLFRWDDVNDEWDFVIDEVTSGGFYSFNGVDEGGLYKVVVAPPGGTEPTLTGQGTDNTIDSDGVNDAGGGAAEVTLGNGGVASQQLDFGFHSTGKVSPGTGTPGYWKNHPEAWAASTAVVGGKITVGGNQYTVSQAIGYMGKVSKDKTITIFSSLLSAKLNVGIGNEDSCIAATIAAADEWMSFHPVGSGVLASSEAWQDISDEHKDLDDYNNGRLCAPHRN